MVGLAFLARVPHLRDTLLSLIPPHEVKGPYLPWSHPQTRPCSNYWELEFPALMS